MQPRKESKVIGKLWLGTVPWLIASVLATACVYQKLSVGQLEDGGGAAGGSGTAGSAGNTPNSGGSSGDVNSGGSGGDVNSGGSGGTAGEAGATGNAGSAGVPPRVLSVLAGKIGGCGRLDGVGSTARLPLASMVWDKQAYLYALGGSGIQKIEVATGNVTTVSTTSVGSATASVIGAVMDSTGTQAFVALSNDTLLKQPLDGSTPTVVAGSATEHIDLDGAAKDARFAFQFATVGMVLDDSGNLFFAESGSQVVRELDTGGTVTTLAGVSGMPGSDDGLAATFNGPSGLALIGQNLYISDSNNRTIRQLDTMTGKVSTVSGTVGMAGSTDGAALTTARYYAPGALAYEAASQQLLVADGTAIRRIYLPSFDVNTLAGQTTVAGGVDGSGQVARFQGISSIATTANGVALLGDRCAVRRMDTNIGLVATLAGSPAKPGSTDGATPGSGLSVPAGIAADADGHVFVADTMNATIRQVDVSSATASTLAGGVGMLDEVDDIGDKARFILPYLGAYAGAGVASDGAGNLFVADTLGMTIRKVVVGTRAVTTIAGAARQYGTIDGAATDARFYQPTGIAYDNQALYIVNAATSRIRKLDLLAQSVSTLAGGAAGANVDAIGTAASFNLTCSGSTRGRMAGIAAYAGNLYVSDCGNHTVRKIDETTADVSTLAGSPGVRGTSDGAGADALFDLPLGIASDGKGNLYVADGGAGTLRKIVIATRQVSTIAGTPYHPGVRLGTSPGLNEPTGVAVLPDGSLAISDAAENALLWLH